MWRDAIKEVTSAGELVREWYAKYHLHLVVWEYWKPEAIPLPRRGQYSAASATPKTTARSSPHFFPSPAMLLYRVF